MRLLNLYFKYDFVWIMNVKATFKILCRCCDSHWESWLTHLLHTSFLFKLDTLLCKQAQHQFHLLGVSPQISEAPNPTSSPTPPSLRM